MRVAASPHAFLLAAALSAAVWALSGPVTGAREPWDAEGPYYLLALALSGALSGALVPKSLWAHYLGAVVGQAVYELVFLSVGPLFLLGLAFLLAYGVVFLAAAAAAAYLRARSAPS